ncbi:MarR family transcriptional regulator [Acidiferrimicrobium sp. IK]|uniref:MarR family winged helix-turn-helix transcriptional regulator n=1 Tax=Acidiferrimicrobium sp. IK TaxID=2871700 RepID=UPI0021CAF87E|nr:MarR family transcriptional regulator [Acidiferrimicrobium sp. IK]MCU4185908.1 MarR family transcriptional regulator [Acidiferrimicrobium sp. IK]
MSHQGSEAIAGHNDVAVALYSLAAAVVRRMPRDISLTAAATLYALERHGPQRLTRLAALEGVTQPSMTALVTKLERSGLAQRRADPTDRRGVLVALTGAGERYVHERRQAGAGGLARLIDELPADQTRSLRDALPALQAVAVLDHRRTETTSRLTLTARGALG